MTETSGSATSNTPAARRIGSVGKALPGIEVKLDHAMASGDPDVGEILVYGHGVMNGYNNQPEETAKVMTADGGLRTGDLGKFDKDGFLFITGRVKELYKLENGKYVAPAPMEEQITLSRFISQAMIFGSDKPYNVALIVPDMAALGEWAKENGLGDKNGQLLDDPKVKKLYAEEIERQSAEWKGYERVKGFKLLANPFTTADDLLTPTLKLKRRNVIKKYQPELDSLYKA
jgi:long-chain acyl-CoA synthetase